MARYWRQYHQKRLLIYYTQILRVPTATPRCAVQRKGCQDDFSLDARMCTGKEFWLSPNAEAPAFVGAWIHSVGFIGIGPSTCSGWRNTGSNGMVVMTDGKPSNLAVDAGCGTARPVTCCAPAQ